MCEYEDIKNKKVYIKRSLDSEDGALLTFEELCEHSNGFYVGNVTGGYKKQLSRAYLCTCIDKYDFGEKGFIACSGNHDYSDHGIKVLIMKVKTNPKVYRYIMEEAGLAPEEFHVKRSRGALPCTKRMIEIIVNNGGSIKRGELREKLLEEGYQVNIAKAIKSNIKNGEIYVEGSAQSPNQIIKVK